MPNDVVFFADLAFNCMANVFNLLVWEAALELLADTANDNEGAVLRARRDAEGMAATRLYIAGINGAFHKLWEALSDDEKDSTCFDWDFCTAWLARHFAGGEAGAAP